MYLICSQNVGSKRNRIIVFIQIECMGCWWSSFAAKTDCVKHWRNLMETTANAWSALNPDQIKKARQNGAPFLHDHFKKVF